MAVDAADLAVPGAPSPPPSAPRAGKRTRSQVADSTIGSPSAFSTSITWPSPPRELPAPPESGRYSLRRNSSGAWVSRISSETLRTPLG